MNSNPDNFKGPCWLAFFLSLMAVLLGSYLCWGVASYLATREINPPVWVRTDGGLLVWGSFWLAAIGGIGLVASVIWLLAEGIHSGKRSPLAQRRF